MISRRGMSAGIRYYDIGFNLCDPMYRGVYHGKQQHASDITAVLQRCRETRVECLLLTGSSISESKETVALARQLDAEGSTPRLYYTIGVHPCCVNEFVEQTESTIDKPSNNEERNQRLRLEDPLYTKGKLRELYSLIAAREQDDGRFRAIGEIGLDYDRFHYSGKHTQLQFFGEQLKLSCLFPKKPLFLHMRNCSDDFSSILEKFIGGFTDSKDEFGWKELIEQSPLRGEMLDDAGDPAYRFDVDRKFVVHSFTGTTEEMERLLNLSPNCYIGMNGTSFKEPHHIENVRRIPLERLLLETDAPWCEIKRTHASWEYLMRGEGATPWLKEAYPDLSEWYSSVKRDRLQKKDVAEWAQTMVKTRNEPCTMGQVATVVANIKEIPLSVVLEKVWENSCAVYGA